MFKKKTMKCLLYLCLFAALFGLYQFYTGDFRLANVSYRWENAHKWTTSPPSDASIQEIKAILNQKFSYLGRGNQTYAFLSADGKYVLKFFRFGHLKPVQWLEWLPNVSFVKKYRNQKRSSQEKRLSNNYQGHWIASTYDCENCGLKFVHLNPTHYLNIQATVIDRIGFSHVIDLDTVTFVLQEKALIARDVFHRLLEKGSLAEAYQKIDQIFELYLSEYQKGVYDRDHNVIDNIGFSANRAIRIDVGKLRYDEEMKNKERYLLDLEEKVVRRINSWVKTHFSSFHPQVVEYLDRKMEALALLS